MAKVPYFSGASTSTLSRGMCSHKDFQPLRTRHPANNYICGNSSTVNGAYVNGATMVNAQDARLKHLGLFYQWHKAVAATRTANQRILLRVAEQKRWNSTDPCVL